jgi:uncharacterized protein (TIGR03435 family)
MDWNVSGGPSWIRTDRFDVTAKANVQGDLTEAKLQPMLAKLLADRFKLKLHRSSSQTAGYALEIAKGGPKLKPPPMPKSIRTPSALPTPDSTSRESRCATSPDFSAASWA